MIHYKTVLFLYFDDRVKSGRDSMGPLATEIIFGFVIVFVCPLMNWLQYQLFFLTHEMFGIHPTTMEKHDYSKLNGLIIFDAHSSTSDGELFPFGWKLILAKVIGYTLYILPCLCIFISLWATNLNNDQLQINTTALAIVFVGILIVLIVVSLLEQINQPGKFHSLAKLIITIVFSMSIMVVPATCSNIMNMELICLMNSNQEACANVRPNITCNSPYYDDIRLKYTTEGNGVVQNYLLESTGTYYFNFLFPFSFFSFIS